MPESRPDRLAIHCHGNRYLDGYALLGQGQVRKFPSLPPPPLAPPSSLWTSPAPCMPGPTSGSPNRSHTPVLHRKPGAALDWCRDRAAGLLRDAVTVPHSICVYSRSAHRISTCNHRSNPSFMTTPQHPPCPVRLRIFFDIATVFIAPLSIVLLRNRRPSRLPSHPLLTWSSARHRCKRAPPTSYNLVVRAVPPTSLRKLHPLLSDAAPL
ncbi:hypothetical protein B0H13DRAFT_869308 [Mycena leptocephala]|nr:hypothetical protein B0H13DRAFT_869308 [Mycena leptocephala]